MRANTPKSKRFIFSRGLPKTGQTVSYDSGDDGDLEKGWSLGGRLTFSVIGSDIIWTDRATGLIWPHSNHITYDYYNYYQALSLVSSKTLAGFTDWRLPNLLEMISLMYLGSSEIFSITDYPQDYYWTSTTSPSFSAYGFMVDIMGGFSVAPEMKVSDVGLVCFCRGPVL